ncbi:MAG: alcohol dehydrogenase catalytic domain-containing protein [Actinobacteria bacterium]|nr:alcohol dehydrogenase catalytic domain-containing protein [Actinomycetota bacterium]
MQKMKSLVLKSQGNLELIERIVPEITSTEVLVRIKAAAICHTDFVVMEGQHTSATYPCILGHEFSGVVQECGAAVVNVKKGDKVTAMSYTYCGFCNACRKGTHNACLDIRGIPFHMEGAFQEKIALPGLMLFKFGDVLSFEEASLTECAANGYSSVDRANITDGSQILFLNFNFFAFNN